jgi:hypothetical protein
MGLACSTVEQMGKQSNPTRVTFITSNYKYITDIIIIIIIIIIITIMFWGGTYCVSTDSTHVKTNNRTTL